MTALERILQIFLDLQLFDSDTSLRATGSAGAATSLVLAAPTNTGKRWAIMEVCVSYSDTPTGGGLQVFDGANPIFDVDIGSSGAHTFAVFRKGSTNNPMTIALKAPGGSVVGKINANARLL